MNHVIFVGAMAAAFVPTLPSRRMHLSRNIARFRLRPASHERRARSMQGIGTQSHEAERPEQRSLYHRRWA